MPESCVAGGGLQSGLEPAVLHLFEVWENLQYEMSWGKGSAVFPARGTVCF